MNKVILFRMEYNRRITRRIQKSEKYSFHE